MVNTKRSANHLNNRKIKEKCETTVKYSQLNKALRHMSELAKKHPSCSSSISASTFPTLFEGGEAPKSLS